MSLPVLVAEVDAEHREDDADNRGSDDLPDCGQAQAVLAANLHVVVDEADRSQPDHHEDDQERVEGWRLLSERLREQVTADGGDDEYDAAHGWGASLDHVSGRRVCAEELTEVHSAEQPGEQWREQQREDQRESTGSEEDDHLTTPARRSARAPRPASSDDFTRTRSRARNSSRKRSYASLALSTSTDSPSHEPSSPAALWMCRAP